MTLIDIVLLLFGILLIGALVLIHTRTSFSPFKKIIMATSGLLLFTNVRPLGTLEFKQNDSKWQSCGIIFYIIFYFTQLYLSSVFGAGSAGPTHYRLYWYVVLF